MTSISTVHPAGRSSQLGEATYRAPLIRPAPVMSTACSALGIELFLDAEPFHAIAQRAERDSEQLRRCRAVVARLLEGVEDRLSLHRVQALLQRQARQVLGRRRRPDARRRKLEII